MFRLLILSAYEILLLNYSLRRGPGANAQDASGFSALHHAAVNRHRYMYYSTWLEFFEVKSKFEYNQVQNTKVSHALGCLWTYLGNDYLIIDPGANV